MIRMNQLDTKIVDPMFVRSVDPMLHMNVKYYARLTQDVENVFRF
jgi:hypothetical protein